MRLKIKITAEGEAFDALILCVSAPLREIFFPSGFAVGIKVAIQAYQLFGVPGNT